MNRIETTCRILRDVGIFLAGLAAIIFVVDNYIIHPDPMREMQREITKAMVNGTKESSKQDTTSSVPLDPVTGLPTKP